MVINKILMISSKYFFLSILLSLFLTSCYKQERNCNDFKTGTFNFTQEIDGKKHISTFVRTDKFQIESYNGKIDTATVRWVNDCEFILQKINPKKMQEKKAISIKILTTSGKTYTFEYSFVGDTKTQRGIVTKID